LEPLAVDCERPLVAFYRFVQTSKLAKNATQNVKRIGEIL
jgi:hypothetical protein